MIHKTWGLKEYYVIIISPDIGLFYESWLKKSSEVGVFLERIAGAVSFNVLQPGPGGLNFFLHPSRRGVEKIFFTKKALRSPVYGSVNV